MRTSRILGLVLVCCATAALLFAAVQWLTWPDVEGLTTTPPERTAFMDAYRARRRAADEDTTIAWRWVEWDRISVHVKRAVVAAEDMEFFSHSGFSASEMEAALREALAGERFRGASTITQQLAKNLWLSPSRNPWRKVKEALLTRSVERHLGKLRILAVYLNVVEFGPGVYGVEAAARRYFGKPAADLSVSEAALLAASLPRPSRWHPGVSSSAYARYAADIEARMARATFLWRALGEQEVPEIPAAPVVDSIVLPTVDSLALPDSAGDPSPGDTNTGSRASRDDRQAPPAVLSRVLVGGPPDGRRPGYAWTDRHPRGRRHTNVGPHHRPGADRARTPGSGGTWRGANPGRADP